MWHKNGSREGKKEGGHGHPCLVPLLIWKESEITPLAPTLAIGVIYAAEIQLNMFLPNPICRSVACMKAQLTRSNAFSASVQINTPGVFLVVAK